MASFNANYGQPFGLRRISIAASMVISFAGVGFANPAAPPVPTAKEMIQQPQATLYVAQSEESEKSSIVKETPGQSHSVQDTTTLLEEADSPTEASEPSPVAASEPDSVATEDPTPEVMITQQPTQQIVVTEVTNPATDKGATTPSEQVDLQQINLLAYMPIPMGGYLATKELPSKFTSHQTVLEILKENRNIPLQLEILRRAYWSLSAGEQMELLVGLQRFHQEAANDPYRFFSLGITKLLMADNQSGLFYLRKANDAINNSFTRLAYGAAQAGVDMRQEKAPADKWTNRKQNAVFMMSDSVRAHGANPLPGFWGAYLRATELLAPLPAYTEYVTADMTDLIVPYGDSVSLSYSKPKEGESTLTSAAIAGSTDATLMAATDLAPQTPATCQRDGIGSNVIRNATRQVYLQVDGRNGYEVIRVLPNSKNSSDDSADSTTTTGEDNIFISNESGQIIGQFSARKAPYIFEDLDSDGLPEVVIRQFNENRQTPVSVYRYDGCTYTKDQAIAQLFE
jgi:methyl coenzyme M reductase subunit C